MSKKTLGWNPTYFGEPKSGSLASVIADITDKQNAVVGDKPHVQSSARVQAEEEKQKQLSQEAVNPAQQAAIAISKKEKGEKPKEEEGNAFGKALQAAKQNGDKTFVVAGMKFDVKTKNEIAPALIKPIKSNKDKEKKDSDVEVHGEDLNAEIQAAQQGKIKSLVDTIIDTYYKAEITRMISQTMVKVWTLFNQRQLRRSLRTGKTKTSTTMAMWIVQTSSYIRDVRQYLRVWENR